MESMPLTLHIKAKTRNDTSATHGSPDVALAGSEDGAAQRAAGFAPHADAAIDVAAPHVAVPVAV